MKSVMCAAKYAVLVSMIFALVGCGVPIAEHEALQQKCAEMEKRATNLSGQLEEAQGENVAIRGRVRGLEGQIRTLTAENRKLKAENERLLAEEEAEPAGATETE